MHCWFLIQEMRSINGEMKQNSQKCKGIAIGILLVLVLLAALFCQKNLSKATMGVNSAAEGFQISLESGFYQEDQQIVIETVPEATVVYTDTGAEPDWENGTVYSAPIILTASEQEQAYVYRFKAYYSDGSESEVINRTYFLGTDITERFTTGVLHVAGNPEDLFGYEEGIFVSGKIYDEYLAANPGKTPDIHLEANFTQRGEACEREVYVEYFDMDGRSLLSQECGIRIFGNVSRIKNQKSFRLYARKEYDEQNEFKYPVLSGLKSLQDGTIAREHKRLVVRNAGTDNGFAFLRSELTARLAAEAGFPDVMYAEPVCVYVNGRYQGFYWIENGFDAQYFVNRYGEYDGQFITVEGGDTLKSPDEDTLVQQYVDEYNQKYAEFAAMDLTNDENYERLQEFLDVENYLQYYAIEYFIGNDDWPQGNVKAYRYVASDGKYRQGTVFDGRYRHLLFDTDFAYGLMLDVYDNKLGKHLSDETSLFANIMYRRDCRDYFANYVCDLFNGAFATENVLAALEEMHLSQQAELYHMLEETDLMENSLWDWEPNPVNTYENVEENCRIIREYAELRPGEIYVDVSACFGYDFGRWYCLNLSKSGMSAVQVNSLLIEGDAYEGYYFGEVPVTLTPIMAKNEVFDYWLVNGEIREEEELSLTVMPEEIVEEQVYVELVVHSVEEPVLQLNAIKAKGKYDYIEIINLSQENISTKGYYLSDSEELHRYSLPVMTIPAGETKRFYGQDYRGADALGECALNFNLKQGETISLSYGTEVLEALVVPEMSENGVYQRGVRADDFSEVLEK